MLFPIIGHLYTHYSIWFLLHEQGITKKRGIWFDKVFGDHKVKIMPTFHPSYVLRKEYMEEGKFIKDNFRKDIKNVAVEAGFVN